MALVQMILGDSCGVMIQVLAIHVVEKTNEQTNKQTNKD